MELQVEVVVTGEASNPDDASLPGVYGHTVILAQEVDPSSFNLAEAGAIAAAVLDEFHDNQGIECLDDFRIEVRLAESGRLLVEMEDEQDHDRRLVKLVVHDGQISAESERPL